jgi:hypothetical protein
MVRWAVGTPSRRHAEPSTRRAVGTPSERRPPAVVVLADADRSPDR